MVYEDFRESVCVYIKEGREEGKREKKKDRKEKKSRLQLTVHSPGVP